MAEGDQADAYFGNSVGTAGDVNADGYSDVIVGAYACDNGQSDEGRAYVYLGSASGLGSSPAWTAESNQVNARFGYSVGTAGDVNGDGYSDVIVGARNYNNGQIDEGQAYVYLGSASGLSATSAWTAESNQANAYFGYPVGTAGDVNGDGYSDVIIGASYYDNGQTDEGRAYVYLGSPSWPSLSLAWTAESDQAGAGFGWWVGTAGDVNGDGYADVIVGVASYDNGETNEGRAYVYLGGVEAGPGLALRPQQRRADNAAPIDKLGKSDNASSFRMASLGRTPFGRGKVKLELEVKPFGTLFDGLETQMSPFWTDTGTAGAALNELVSAISSSANYHWRARLHYNPVTTPFQQMSRWFAQPWGGWQETDLRTACAAPASLINDDAADLGCGDTGVQITWAQDAGDWSDGGIGTRTYDVLRGGSPIQTGIAYGTTTWTDTTGVNGTTYIYAVRYNNGCGLNAVTAGASAADWVTPGSVTLTVTDVSACARSGVTLTFSGGAPSTQYDLYVDTVLTQPDITSGYVYSPGNGNAHDYTVRAVYGPYLTDSNTVNATDANNPLVPTVTGPGANACPAETVLLTTQSGQSNYQWYLGGLPIGGATADQYTVTAPGSYSVSYTNTSGCSGASSPHAVTITTCTAVILYQSHGAFTEVTGDGDANFERGEKWSVAVTLVNDGPAGATNVTAQLSGVGIRVCNNPGTFGTMPMGGTATYTFEFFISPAFSPCGGPIAFNVVNKTSAEKTPAGPAEGGVFSIANVGQYGPGTPTDLVIQPSVSDTYVNEQSPATNYGTSATMNVQRRTAQRQRTLVQFDLSQIPAGAAINSATLELYATAAPGTGQQLDVHHVMGTWTEPAVTWTTQPAYNASADATLAGGTTTGWKVWDVLPVVQAWSEGTYPNYGLLVKCNLETDLATNTYTFASRENAMTAYRPILRVNYTSSSPVWDCSYMGSGMCGTTAPPPVKDTGAYAARFTKGSGDILDVTYDASTCFAEKVIILCGGLGAWTGYAGCAQSDGGNGGSTTVDSAAQNNVWYNLLWTQGTTAGHPGFATGAGRTLTAGTLCGMTADDPSNASCP
jgi:hypothetical protein